MFKELAPLLRHRAVLFTVAHVEEDTFRVNVVIPKKVSEADNDALITLSASRAPSRISTGNSRKPFSIPSPATSN